MGHQAQTLLTDQPTCNTTNTECLITDPQEGIFKVFDELLLATSELGGLFAAQGLTAILDHFEGRARVVRAVVVIVGQGLFQKVVVLPGLVQFAHDQVLELHQLIIVVPKLVRMFQG